MKKIVYLATALMLFTACSMRLPVSSSGPVTGSKTGTSKAVIILGFYFNQDASIEAAAQAGGITTVHTVSVEHRNILNVYQTIETRVTGE